MACMINDARPGYEDYRNTINNAVPGKWPEGEGNPRTASHGDLGLLVPRVESPVLPPTGSHRDMTF